MPIADQSGCRLHYDLHGEPSAAPLVLIRGLARSGRYWGPFLDLMAARAQFRLLVLDNRGVGKSGVTRPPYTTAQLADDVTCVLDHAGVARAHVFGISLGGMVAQELALRHPARVDHLVLGCTTAGGRRSRRNPWRAVAALIRSGFAAPQRSLDILVPYLLAEDTLQRRPEIATLWLELARAEPLSRGGVLGQLIAAGLHDTWDRLPSIRAPTLVITGDADRLTPPENSRLLAQRIPGARLELLPGAGHDFTTDQPERSVDIVSAFLLDQQA